MSDLYGGLAIEIWAISQHSSEHGYVGCGVGFAQQGFGECFLFLSGLCSGGARVGIGQRRFAFFRGYESELFGKFGVFVGFGLHLAERRSDFARDFKRFCIVNAPAQMIEN